MELNGGTIIIFPCGFLYEKRGVIYAMKSLKIVQIAKSLKFSQCVAMCILFFKKSWNQFFLMNFSKFYPKLKADVENISHIEWKATETMKIGKVSCGCLFNLVCAVVRRSNICLVLKIYGLFLLSAVEEK